MTRFYVPLDVNYQLDDKIMCAGHVAECLYIRSLAYAKRAGTEGSLKRSQLPALALGLPGRPAKHADTLVNVGLWDLDDGGGGWYITGWLNHNLSNADLAEQKAKIKAKSIAGNHKRHHVDKGIVDVDCELCRPPTGEPSNLPNGSHRGKKTLPIEEEQKLTESNRTEDKSSSSSTGSGKPRNGRRPDDDELFLKTINILVESKARDHPPRDRDAWEPVTRADLIATKGDQVRAEIALGSSPLAAAATILHSQAKAELAAGRL